MKISWNYFLPRIILPHIFRWRLMSNYRFKTLFFIFVALFFSCQSAFSQVSFVIKDVEKGTILECRGDIEKRVSPCSTFKIALSLMGYDSGILINEFLPQ